MLCINRLGYPRGSIGEVSILPSLARVLFLCVLLLCVNLAISGESVIRKAGAVDTASDFTRTPSFNVFSRWRASDAITPFFVNSELPSANGNNTGFDYRIGDQFVLGGGSTFMGFTDKADFDAGIGDEGQRNLSFYGTYSQDNFFIDGKLGFGRREYDLEQNIAYAPKPGIKRTIDDNSLAQSLNTDAEAEEFFAGLGMGYRFSSGAFSLTPSLHIDYANVDIAGLDAFTGGATASSGAAFDGNEQRLQSLTSTLGGHMSYAVNQDWGVVVPFGRIEWVHEFEDNANSYTMQLLEQSRRGALSVSGESADDDYFNLGLGVSAQFGSGRAAFLSYEQVFGKEDTTNQYSITGGVRFEF